MPPRKSNVSQVTATDPEGTPSKERDGINIEDLSLPRTMVQRLAKGVLPPNTILHKDAILAMSKGATVFINYLAQAANASTTNANKRTIPPEAVLEALVDLEFESFVPRVEAELKKYLELQVGKRNEYRRKVKAEKMWEKGEEEGNTLGSAGDEGEEEENEGGRASKRVRRESGEEEMSPGGGVGSGDGHEQLLMHDPYRDGEEEDFDGQGEEEEGIGGDEEANTSRGLRGRPSQEGEEEEEEEHPDEVEEDDDVDDDDEYPDEGRRLSSVEREANEGPYERSPRYADPAGSSGDEEGLSEVSD